MLTADSTSAAVRQTPAELSNSDSTDWTSISLDRTPRDVAAAVDVLRRADDAADRALSDQEARALDLLYRRYSSAVARVAGAIVRNLADAEDVTQDVFLDLPRALRRYQPGNFEGWIKTVTARTALMRLRKQTRERDVQTSFAMGTDETCRGEGDVLADSDRIQRAVARLPKSLRHVVELRLLRGLPHAEIGQQLGLSPNACEVRLCRAIKQLRVMVGEAA